MSLTILHLMMASFKVKSCTSSNMVESCIGSPQKRTNPHGSLTLLHQMQVFDTCYGRDQESKQSCGVEQFRKPRDPDLRSLENLLLSQLNMLAFEIFGIVCFIEAICPCLAMCRSSTGASEDLPYREPSNLSLLENAMHHARALNSGGWVQGSQDFGGQKQGHRRGFGAGPWATYQ